MKTKQNQLARIFTRVITTAAAVASAISIPSAVAETVPVSKPGSISRVPLASTLAVISLASPSDPRFNSWMLNESGQLASIRLEDGADATTSWQVIDQNWKQFRDWKDLWTELTGLNAQPTVSSMLADVTAIDYNSSYIYVTANGLASYTMGPWYKDVDEDGDGYVDSFEFRPLDRTTANQYAGTPPIAMIPRNPPSVPIFNYDVWSATCESIPLGAIGVWVNGTSVYGAMDGFHYKAGVGDAPATLEPGMGAWNGDAYWAESVTFDAAGFHQDAPGLMEVGGKYAPIPTWGQHHAHINPMGLRCQLNDHVVAVVALSDQTGELPKYTEFPPLVGHSPILGWAFDGYPIYGPYGYSNRFGPVSDLTLVRRMRSGYTLRNGLFGTRDLNNTGRDQLPDWAVELGRKSETGPSPGSWEVVKSASGTVLMRWFKPDPDFPLGCFVEDWDYRGDLAGGGSLYTDWDLDRYNGRWCVTPEFPDGTYAYFVALDEDLSPQFPYIIGPAYKAEMKGGEVGSVPFPHLRY